MNFKKHINTPKTSPELIFELRESAFANDLFITAVSHFDFFNFLGKHPSNFNEISKSLDIKKRPLDVMLTLFKAYVFIEEKEGKYYLSEISHDYLTDKSAFNLSSYVSSLKDSPVCQEMKKVLLTGEPANWAAGKKTRQWAASMEQKDFAKSFTEGMNSRGEYLANGLLEAVDLKTYSKILDVGGGSGIYSAVLLKSNTNLEASVYEKPPIDKLVLYTIHKFKLGERMNAIPGDMFRNDLPRGYDLHLISHVLHDWDIDKVEYILKNSFNNLDPGGIVIIHDAHINESKNGPVSVAEYSVLLMFLSEGKCYSTTEIKDILKQIGFVNIKYRSTILNRSIITGIKPK